VQGAWTGVRPGPAPPAGSASFMASRMRPMAVLSPVPTTTPRARPTVITVPLYAMHVLSCTTALT